MNAVDYGETASADSAVGSHREARMNVAQRISEAAFEQIVWSDPARKWELLDGRLVEKPGTCGDHGRIISRLAHQLQVQLNAAEYEVRTNEVRVRKPVDTIVVPDLLVIPTAYRDSDSDWSSVPILTKPLLLVVEVWVPPTGDYDVDAKIPVYQQRGDLEIWRIHPHDRSLTSWVRQANGTYAETVYQSGLALPVMLTKSSGARFNA
jgi:Uma2 family endonuclease